MALDRSAKTLSRKQIATALAYLDTTRHPTRNKVIFLLSVKSGLRAKEISRLTWTMVTDAEGNLDYAIRLPNTASKGKNGGRVIPLAKELRTVLASLRELPTASESIVVSERGRSMVPAVVVNLFSRWYRDLCYEGCSSHSGRRTFITSAAKQISVVGGSIRDVQMLAGHSSLGTTQRYIEYDVEAQRRVVELM